MSTGRQGLRRTRRHPTSRHAFFAIVLIALGTIRAVAAETVARPRAFAPGQWRDLGALPQSPLRDRLQQLHPTAQERARQWLQSFPFTELDLPSLHADPAGGIYYVCSEAVPQEPSADLPAPPPLEAAAVPVSPFPSSLRFHSRPGAPNVLFLNFAGETVTGTAWNTSLGLTDIPALPLSTDTDHTTYSDTEQLIIRQVWLRVAEDYAPFDLDVTTERPTVFGTRTAHALITQHTNANGTLNPSSSAGGVAYVNVFGTSSYAQYRPAWIYHDNLANSGAYITEAVSHEIGHNLGLSHDGKTDGTEYYGGHGSGDISWGPLMGTGYNRNVSHWSKGDYYLANNTQDDLATIAAKVSYRTDDHGNTPGTATPLTLTGTTNLVATTPDTDPTNTQPDNKGVIERTTDFDVFSFVTGTGPVRLAVNPWIMPSGTRGGNLDLAIELYDDTGTLLLTNNPPTLTTALIQTDLTEGRYYLQVRNAAAGDPFAATPTGYTVYGSIGQYFISGFVSDPSSVVIAPTAELQVTDLVALDQPAHPFTVIYSDDLALDVSTLDSADLRITGPRGYDRSATFVQVDFATDGTPRTATYAADPPAGGVWTATDNGTYTVWMQTGQVADVSGAPVPAATLGQFTVAVPVAIYTASMDVDPGWTLEPEWEYGPPAYTSSGPTSGATGTQILGYNLSGNYANNLTVKYATTPPINTSGNSTLTLQFQRWLRSRNSDPVALQVSTNNSTWITVWSSTSAVSDTSWREVQYPLPAEVSGSPSLRVRWSIASNQTGTEIGWNLDDIVLLGDASTDFSPPVPTLNVAPLIQGGSPTHPCSVTYADDTAVRLTSLNATDLIVTGPNGYSNAVEFVGADLPDDGAPITATYSIPAPGGSWDAADNGAYELTLVENEVLDTLDHPVPRTALGAFDVTIAALPPGILDVSPATGLAATGTAGGPFTPTSLDYTLTNSGGTALDWIATHTQDWIGLSAAIGTLDPGESTTVTVALLAAADALNPGVHTDTVSFANATTVGAAVARSVSLTILSPGLLEVSPALDLIATGTLGGPFTPTSLDYTLTNSGGTALDWTATHAQDWVGLSVTNGPLAPGASITVTVSLLAAADALSPGVHTDTVSFTDATSGSAVATRAVSLTVHSPGLLEVSPALDLIATGTVGGPFTPTSLDYTLTNSGGTALDWTATHAQDWVGLSVTNGTLDPGTSTTVTVSLLDAADALSPGVHTDTVTFTDATAGSAVATLAVSLTIHTPGLLEVSPALDLVAAGTVGGPFTPTFLDYTLTNSGGTTLDWVVTHAQDWVGLSVTNGTLAPGESTTVTVSLLAAADALSPGVYADTLTFTDVTAGSAATTRAVSLTIHSPGLLEVSPTLDLVAAGTVGGPFTPNALDYTLTNSGGTALDWTAAHTQDWVGLSATNGTLAPGTSTTVTVSLLAAADALSPGVHTDTVAFANATTSSPGTTLRVELTVYQLLLTLTLDDPNPEQPVLRLTGPPLQSYIIDHSSDLIQWMPAATNQTDADGLLILIDPQATRASQRFYRARTSP